MKRRDWIGSALAASAASGFDAPTKLPAKVRLAVVGQVGHLGEITRPLPLLPDVELVAYHEPAAADLARLGKQKAMQGAQGHTDLRRMLDQVKPDVVAVVNDDGARAGAVLEVVSRGIHCIAEKPLSIDRPSLEKIEKTVRAGKAKFSMLVPLRYAPQFKAVREVVRSGEIGEVLLLGGQKSYRRGADSAWKNKRATYGSTMLWIGPHLIDLFHFSSGLKMTEAFCWQANVKDPSIGERENVVGAVLRLENGGIAEMRMDYLRPDAAPSHEDDRLRVAGTKGVVEFTAATGVTVISEANKSRRIEALPEKGEIFVDFLKHIYNGAAATLTMDEIFHVSRAIQAAEDSSRLGRPVKV
jgi:predicted dehydrogenase